MYDGIIEYRGHIDGIEFGPLELHGTDSSVPRIVLASSQDGDLTLAIYVTKVDSLDEASAITDAIATSIANSLAYDRGRSVTGPQFAGHSLMREVVEPDGTTRKEGIVSQRLTLTVKAAATVKAGETTEKKIRAALEVKTPPGARYFGVFRSALNTGDPVSKFMSLYNILLLLNNDRQADVDAFIKRVRPAAPETPSPVKKGVMGVMCDRIDLERLCQH